MQEAGPAFRRLRPTAEQVLETASHLPLHAERKPPPWLKLSNRSALNCLHSILAACAARDEVITRGQMQSATTAQARRTQRSRTLRLGDVAVPVRQGAALRCRGIAAVRARRFNLRARHVPLRH